MDPKLSFPRSFLIIAVMASLVLMRTALSYDSEPPRQEQTRVRSISTPSTESMVNVGGRKLHCFVYGAGSPTVVLVSGLEIPQVNWDSVVPQLAAKTTVVTYDRAGLGKSELGGLPTDGERAARDLHALLKLSGVPGPFLLIGHSYGGMVVRLYASLYPEDMGGLILEDSQHEDNLIKMREILGGKDLEAFEHFVGERFRTPEKPVSEADYLNMTRDELRKSGPLPRIPFAVLVCAGRAKAMKDLFSQAAIERLDQMDNDLNNKLTALIPAGRLIRVEGTGHLIHVDKPGILIAPAMEIIDGIRKKKQGCPERLQTGRRMKP